MKRIISVCLLVVAILALLSACDMFHKHQYGEWTVSKAATCTEEGIKTRICSCGEEESEKIPPLGHEHGIIEGRNPTCTEAGLTDGSTCNICGDILEEQREIPAAGHDVVVYIAVEPTCQKNGVTEGRQCSICDEVFAAQEEIPALGHDIIVDEAKAPTCTETGLTAGEHCSRCSYKLAQEVIPAKGHTEVIDNAVAPDCVNSGLTEGKHCSVCDEVLVAQETVDKLGHDIIVDEAKAPTCTETGLTAGEHCSRCSYKLAQETIPAKGHTDENPKDYICDICQADLCTDHSEEIIPAKAATCTESGLTEGKKCSICGEILVAQQTVSALGHTEVIDAAKAPDCVNIGLTEGKHCSVCNEVLVAQKVVEALGHTEVIDNAVAPDCVNSGLTEGKHCSVCNAVLVAQKVVDALGHTEVIDNAVAPDCTNTGLTEGKHCSVCNEVLVAQNVVAALGHTEVIDNSVAPDCTNTGLTEGKHCSVCNEVLVAQEIVPANGHTEVIDNAVAPDCVNTGLTEGKHCSVCNKVLVAQEIVPANGHTEVIDNAVAPNCTNTGLTEGKHCSVCNEVLVAQNVVAALGHTEVIDAAKAPDCTNTGLTEGKHCSVCNEVLVAQKVVEALGHTEVIDNAVAPDCVNTGLTEGKHCSVCNKVLVAQKVVDALGHKSSDAIEENRTEATCVKEGKYDSVIYCSACNEELSRESITIPAKGHDYENGSIASTYPGNCQSPSSVTKLCANCNWTQIFYGEINPEIHANIVTDEAKAPTCTETGLTEGSHCSACNEVIAAQETVDALGHTAGDKEYAKIEAGVCPCEAERVYFILCTVCGEQMEMGTDEAVGHSFTNYLPVKYEDDIPVCTITPMEIAECDNCDCLGCIRTDIRITGDAPGHKVVVDDAVAPTCTESGLTEGSHCSVCDTVFAKQEVVPANGHTEVIDKAVAPDCVNTGLTEGKHCSVCNEVLIAQDIVPANGHSYSEGECTACGKVDVSYTVTVYFQNNWLWTDVSIYYWYDGSDTTLPGIAMELYGNDGVYDIYSAEIPLKATGIIFNGVKNDGTGDRDQSPDLTSGWYDGICYYMTWSNGNQVGSEFIEVILPPPCEHSYTVKATAPTCTENGLNAYTCSACGDSYSEVIPALGHKFEVTEKTNPSCTSAGYISYTCSGCGEGYTETNGEALGHTAGDPVIEGEVVEADCINSGHYYSAVYCTACGTQISGERVVIPANGHSYDNHICSVCGIDDPDHYFVMTIPEALNAVDGKKVEVSGTVCTINTIWTDENNNLSVTIIDGNGKQLYIYRLATKVELGDVITINGAMATYNGNRQIGQGATATIDGHDTGYDYTEMTIDEALAAPDNTNVIVSGIVVEIGIAYDSGYNNMSVYISSNNGVRLYVYRLTGEVTNGDIITIKGSMGTYNGQRQITGGTFEKTGEHNCFDIASPTCQKGRYCVFCGKSHGEPNDHKDSYDANYLCDYGCGTVMPPRADSTLTIEKALYLGGLYSSNVFTEGKYYVTGKITSIASTTYGNMYIEDGNGNSIYVYGFYNADGSARFDAMENQPAVGDMVTVYAIVGQYGGTIELKNAWMIERYPGVDGSVGLSYSLNEDGQSYTVTGRGVCPDTDIVIPAEYQGLPVTCIGTDAFWNDEIITSVVIPESITELGNYTFYAPNLASVTILSNSITTLPSRTFAYTKITSITLPESLKVIDRYAFQGCYYLETIYIPKGLESVGTEAFDGCPITTVYYGGSEADWANISIVDYCNDAIKNAPKVYNYVKPSEGLAFNVGTDNTAQLDNMGTCTDTTVVVPATTSDGYAVSGIESMAFYKKTEITSVILPVGVKVIGNDAFGLCSSLASISLPDSVEEIGNGVFADCTSLTSIRLPASLTSLGKNVFYGCTSLTEIYYNGSIDEWNSLSKDELWDNSTTEYTVYCSDATVSKDGTINNYASKGLVLELNASGISYSVIGIDDCDDTNLVIPNVYKGLPVTSIGSRAFDNCTSFTSVTIGSNVTSIGDYAFNCTSITSVIFSNSVVSIGEGAFNHCLSLTNVIIPDNVTSIGIRAFSYCSSLTSVTIGNSVTNIGSDAFCECTLLTSVTIGNSVTSIGSSAFYCTALTSITLPESVTYIDMGVFADSTSLTKIYYNGSIEKWNSISKADGEDCWDYGTADYTIYCTDGEISKDGTVTKY